MRMRIRRRQAIVWRRINREKEKLGRWGTILGRVELQARFNDFLQFETTTKLDDYYYG